MDPEVPPNRNLTRLTARSEVDRQDHVTFQCDPGTWFEHDRDLLSYNVTCVDNNTLDWEMVPICLPCKYGG